MSSSDSTNFLLLHNDNDSTATPITKINKNSFKKLTLSAQSKKLVKIYYYFIKIHMQ